MASEFGRGWCHSGLTITLDVEEDLKKGIVFNVQPQTCTASKLHKNTSLYMVFMYSSGQRKPWVESLNESLQTVGSP